MISQEQKLKDDVEAVFARAETEKWKVVRGPEGYQLVDGDGRMWADGMGSRELAVIQTAVNGRAALVRERDALEADYQRIIGEVLACHPRGASSRDDGQLEPPWEVIARVRSERDEARALAWRNAECAAAHTTEAYTLSSFIAARQHERIALEAQLAALVDAVRAIRHRDDCYCSRCVEIDAVLTTYQRAVAALPDPKADHG